MKTVLITGAGRGLGFCLAEECAHRGYRVLAAARGKSERLAELCRENSNVTALNADVSDYGSVAACRKQAQAYTDCVDLVINNAGIFLDLERLPLEDERFSFDIFAQEYDVNAVAPLRVVREFLPLLRKSAMKTIVNISSEAGSMGMQSWRKSDYTYCMSKAALNSASNLLQLAYGEEGIKVYAVNPGWMRTDMGGANATDDPMDSARNIMDLAEGDRKEFVFCDCKGSRLEW